jgi:tetratricopeptide (TPR) repeat protein
MVALWQGNLEDASTHFTHQLALSRSLANRQATSLALVGLINYNYELGHLDEAERNITLALDLGESAGLRLVTPYMHTYSGLVARARGDLTGAIACFEKAVGLFRELKAALGIAEATFNLGRALLESGEVSSGVAGLRESHDLVLQLQLSLPGPLPAALLALHGEMAPGDIPLHLGKRASILAELHLLLHRLEGGAAHLERAGAILKHMSRHLVRPATELFWSHYPPARAWKAMIDSPEPRG